MELTASSSSRALWSIYQAAPVGQRLLAAARPFICPLGPMVSSVPAGAGVLDIGCGNGLFLNFLARFKAVEHGIGIDVNERAVASARRVARSGAVPLEFSCVSSTEDWPAGPFDVVSMIDVMHHLPLDLRRHFLHEALKRVGPGGYLVYKDMCSAPWWRVGWNALHDLILARELVTTEKVARVVEWAGDAGFEVVERRSYSSGLGLYGHEFVVFQRRTEG